MSTSTSTAQHTHAGNVPSETPQRYFRTDIQALRAIAVILVFIYHLRPNRMPGGFIGVDVFFVISGFLITSHLIREATLTGRVKLGRFWAARARRILPASLTAIAATVLMTAWLAPVTSLQSLQKQALASTFYVQNWVLAGESVDYLASENEATAFQHFWTLSVEEQFYLFWPVLILLALWALTRRHNLHYGTELTDGSAYAFRRLLLVIFGVVTFSSLLYSVIQVSTGNPDAYFATTTRVWELAAGGILAAIDVRIGRPLRYTLRYAGLAAIGYSALTITSETPFPGVAALPVILGTVAVLMAGTPSNSGDPVELAKYDPWTFASRWRIAQWFGDRSYSLYLWHFPVIVIWAMVAPRQVDYLDVVGMAVLSIVLAHLSYELIEQPLRRFPYFKNSTRRSLWGAIISMLVVTALTFAYPVSTHRAAANGNWDALAAKAEELPAVGAAVSGDGEVPTFTTTSAMMTPNPLYASDDRDSAFAKSDCVSEQDSDDDTLTCRAGDDSSSTRIVIVGDSHMRMYSSALAKLVEDRGWSLQTYLRNKCAFTPIPRQEEVDGLSVCTEPNKKIMQNLLDDPPSLDITTSTQKADFIDDAAASTGFANYWNTLEDAGIPVLVLRDAPRMSTNVPDCVAENYDEPDACAVALADAFPGQKVFDEAVRQAPDVEVADFSDHFCTASECKAVIGNVIAYTDSHHISDTMAISLIPSLAKAIDEALARG